MPSRTLIQFRTRADAYAFAAELRRMAALVDTGTLRVHNTECGHIVEMPDVLALYGGLADVVRRFEGRVASTEMMERLGVAVARAEASAHEALRSRAASIKAPD